MAHCDADKYKRCSSHHPCGLFLKPPVSKSPENTPLAPHRLVPVERTLPLNKSLHLNGWHKPERVMVLLAGL